MILYCTNTHLLDVHMIHTLHSSQRPGIIHWSHWYEMVLIHLDTKKSGSTTSKANSVPEMSDLSSRKKAIGKAWTLFDSLDVNGDHTISLEDRGSRARVPERRWDIHVQLQLLSIFSVRESLWVGIVFEILRTNCSCKHELYHPCWKLYVSQSSSWCKMWVDSPVEFTTHDGHILPGITFIR